MRRRRTSSFEFFNFLFAQAFDVHQHFLGGVRETLHGVHARLDKLFNVRRGDAALLRMELWMKIKFSRKRGTPIDTSPSRERASEREREREGVGAKHKNDGADIFARTSSA